MTDYERDLTCFKQSMPSKENGVRTVWVNNQAAPRMLVFKAA